MAPKLIIISGADTGREYDLFPGQEIKIGRDADNDIVIADPIVSRHHCKIWNDNGDIRFKDVNSQKGTWVNDRFLLKGVLDHRDHLEFGGTTIMVAKLPLSGVVLPGIIHDEIDRQRKMETLRADYTTRDVETIRQKDVNRVLLRMIDSLKAVGDLDQLQATLLEMALEIIPARRAAFLLNGVRVAPEDFVSEIYRERDFAKPAPFKLSGTMLAQVYKDRQTQISNNITPVICVPFAPKGVMRGIIYMEGQAGRCQFDPEHQVYLESIATVAETVFLLNKDIETTKATCDVYKQELQADRMMIGDSHLMQEVRENIRIVAESDTPVLIVGETGTGKELVARAIHELSARVAKRLIVINCAALSDTLFDSEIFGYEKGAFTGAITSKPGKLVLADGGTLFMDEIRDLRLEFQAKLLRAIEYQEFEALGAIKSTKVNVRLIAATNMDLKELVRQGKFREDFMHRLNTFTIHLPPLRNRREDIPLLVNHYLQKFGAKRGVTSIEPAALDALVEHAWPGNIRELKNFIEWATLVSRDGPTVRLDKIETRLDETVPQDKTTATPVNSFEPGETLQSAGEKAAKRARKEFAQRVVASNDGNKEAAATQMGCSPGYLYRILRQTF